MQLITNLQDIKVYYPFLRNKKDRIQQHFENIISYLLISDKVLLSPSHIFNADIARKNIHFLNKNTLIKELFKHGLIITTTNNKSVGDYQELIEERSRFTNLKIKNFNPPLFYRNPSKQKEIYSVFFKQEFKLLKENFYHKDNYKYIQRLVKTNPDHEHLVKVIKRKTKIESKEIQNKTTLISDLSYLKAGADGNGAIMPTINTSNNYTFFNDFYSLKFAQQFKHKLKSKIKYDITNLSFDKFYKLHQSLKPFKDSYFKSTNELNELSEKLYLTLRHYKAIKIYRYIKHCINLILGTYLAARIEDFLLPIVNLKNNYDEYGFRIGLGLLAYKIDLIKKIIMFLENFTKYHILPLNIKSNFYKIIDEFEQNIPKNIT